MVHRVMWPAIFIAWLIALLLSAGQVQAAATLLPNGQQCFQATSPTSGGLSGPLTTLGNITGGSGYVNASYSNVPLIGGSGFGATATVTVTSNAVSSVSITNPGSHYSAGDTLSAAAANLGGSGSGFSVPVSAVSTTGTGMLGLLGTIIAGSGGTNGTYAGVALTGGSGTGATANITVSGGSVTAVAVLNPGSGYAVADTLSAASGNIGGVTGFSVPVSSVSINQSLAGGTVGMYIPLTNTLKQTWQNAAQTVLNTNPITLDQNGCATIYGTGSYRQVLMDALGDIVWDKITTDTSANENVFWAGIAGGTPNVITVVDPGFNGTDGSIINFTALNTNTGATTLNPSSFGNVAVVKDTSAGPQSLSGGEIVQNNPISVIYRASDNSFHILNPIVTLNVNQCLLLTSFGGAGNNSTDNTTPLQNAFAAMTGNGGCIYFQPGKYKFNSQPTINLPSGIFSLKLIGSGQDNTILTWPNINGGLLVNYGGTQSSTHFSDMSFTTSVAGGGSGVTLNLSSSVANPANTAQSDFTRVAFRGDDGYAVSAYWNNAIDDLNVSNINFDGLSITGAASPNGNGISLTGDPGASTYAVQFNIAKSNFNYLTNGILYGPFVQGVTVSQSNFVGGTTGIGVPSGAGLPSQLAVTASQFNASSFAINIAHPQFTTLMVGSTMFIVPANATGIGMAGTAQFEIVGNNFAAVSATGSTGVSITGAFGQGGIIGHNLFTTLGTAITIGAGFTSGFASLSLNDFVNNTADYNISPSSSTTTIDDNRRQNVSQLPACNTSIAHSRSFVLDANSVTFAATAAGGGVNNMNVICDGSSWTLH